MDDKPQALEDMDCSALLREMSRLVSERDHLQSKVATLDQVNDEQIPQAASMLELSSRLDRIGELLKTKGCQES